MSLQSITNISREHRHPNPNPNPHPTTSFGHFILQRERKFNEQHALAVAESAATLFAPHHVVHSFRIHQILYFTRGSTASTSTSTVMMRLADYELSSRAKLEQPAKKQSWKLLNCKRSTAFCGHLETAKNCIYRSRDTFRGDLKRAVGHGWLKITELYFDNQLNCRQTSGNWYFLSPVYKKCK